MASPQSVRPVNVVPRLYGFLLPYRYPLLGGLICVLIDVGAELTPGLVWAYIVDTVVLKKYLAGLLPALGILVALQAIDALSSSIRTRLLEGVGQRFVFDLRAALHDKLMRLPLGYYGEARTGDLMSRMGADVDAVQDVVIRGTDSIVGNTLRLLGVAGVMLWLSPVLGAATLFPLVLVGILLGFFNRRVKGVYRAARERLGLVNAKAQDDIGGVRVVKSFARETDETNAFRGILQDYLRENLRAISLRASFFPFARWIASWANAVMIGFGAFLIIQGQFTLGKLVAYRSYGRYFFGPIDDLTQINDVLQRAGAAAERIFAVLDAPETVADAPDARELPPVNGEIRLENVTFRYQPGQPPVFENLSLRVAPGQTAAIVGPSGAGKSTLFALVQRFWDPETGRVLLDDHDLRTVTQTSLRRQVVAVPQETFLFPTTVKENIRYARPDANDTEVETAARAANAHNFITGLPDGYDTLIGERGVKLSGGQRQRLAVARAFLADGRVLLLDEATSAVEPESERIIQEAIDRLMQGRTTLVATHRLSTVRNADVILVFDGKGGLAEQGTHDELLRRENGMYARMVRQQEREPAEEFFALPVGAA